MCEGNIPTTTLIEDLLRQSGFTVECPVEFEYLRVEKRGRSFLYHLALRCSGSADVPDRLLLKAQDGWSREAKFYQDTRGMNLPIPRCYGTRLGTNSLILMEDFSESHSDARDWPQPVSLQSTREIIAAVAQLHTSFWDSASAGELPDFLTSSAAYKTFIGHLHRDCEIYYTGLEDVIQPDRLRLIQGVLAYLPQLWEEFWVPRLASGNAMPLIHGDLNPCNILYPHQTGGRVVIVDWEAYRKGLPASDLAMLLGLHLCPNQDEVRPYLHAYHSELLQAGVEGYSLDNLLQDYHTALLFELFFPIKLYSHSGIHDQTMIDNAVQALESFSDALD